MYYQSYIDIDHDCQVITSHSDEATINCWCQEINIVELKKIIELNKQRQKLLYKIKKWFSKTFKR